MSGPRQADEVLADLQFEFTEWRSNEATLSKSIPETLLHKSADLSNHLENPEVRRVLGISSKEWKRIQSKQARDESQ